MPPRIPPAIGASQNSHSCLIAQPPTNRAGPGTAIRVHAGTYGGGTYISNVSGEPSAPIWIGGVPGESKPLIQNGGEGLHLTKVSYLVIHDLEVADATSNGINCDDGGDYANEAAAHHVVFRNLDIHDIDELVEVAPTAIRVRTRVLAANQRPRTRKGAAYRQRRGTCFVVSLSIDGLQDKGY
jgi:hypothetical protein